MSRSSFAALAAAFTAFTASFGPFLRSSDPSPAYRPKRTKIKGHQKGKKRGRK